ncbi:unnamed protein product [Closterium sp. Naga37s-1]|nr:unnamed protein product [Closterium sp. Naga37s-1]
MEQELVSYAGVAWRGRVVADYGRETAALAPAVTEAIKDLPPFAAQLSLGCGRVFALIQRARDEPLNSAAATSTAEAQRANSANGASGAGGAGGADEQSERAASGVAEALRGSDYNGAVFFLICYEPLSKDQARALLGRIRCAFQDAVIAAGKAASLKDAELCDDDALRASVRLSLAATFRCFRGRIADEPSDLIVYDDAPNAYKTRVEERPSNEHGESDSCDSDSSESGSGSEGEAEGEGGGRKTKKKKGKSKKKGKKEGKWDWVKKQEDAENRKAQRAAERARAQKRAAERVEGDSENAQEKYCGAGEARTGGGVGERGGEKGAGGEADADAQLLALKREIEEAQEQLERLQRGEVVPAVQAEVKDGEAHQGEAHQGEAHQGEARQGEAHQVRISQQRQEQEQEQQQQEGQQQQEEGQQQEEEEEEGQEGQQVGTEGLRLAGRSLSVSISLDQYDESTDVSKHLQSWHKENAAVQATPDASPCARADVAAAASDPVPAGSVVPAVAIALEQKQPRSFTPTSNPPPWGVISTPAKAVVNPPSLHSGIELYQSYTKGDVATSTTAGYDDSADISNRRPPSFSLEDPRGETAAAQESNFRAAEAVFSAEQTNVFGAVEGMSFPAMVGARSLKPAHSSNSIGCSGGGSTACSSNSTSLPARLLSDVPAPLQPDSLLQPDPAAAAVAAAAAATAGGKGGSIASVADGGETFDLEDLCRDSGEFPGGFSGEFPRDSSQGSSQGSYRGKKGLASLFRFKTATSASAGKSPKGGWAGLGGEKAKTPKGGEGDVDCDSNEGGGKDGDSSGRRLTIWGKGSSKDGSGKEKSGKKGSGKERSGKKGVRCNSSSNLAAQGTESDILAIESSMSNISSPLTGTPNSGTPLAGTPQAGTPLAGTPKSLTPRSATLPSFQLPVDSSPQHPVSSPRVHVSSPKIHVSSPKVITRPRSPFPDYEPEQEREKQEQELEKQQQQQQHHHHRQQQQQQQQQPQPPWGSHPNASPPNHPSAPPSSLLTSSRPPYAPMQPPMHPAATTTVFARSTLSRAGSSVGVVVSVKQGRSGVESGGSSGGGSSREGSPSRPFGAGGRSASVGALSTLLGRSREEGRAREEGRMRGEGRVEGKGEREGGGRGSGESGGSAAAAAAAGGAGGAGGGLMGMWAAAAGNNPLSRQPSSSSFSTGNHSSSNRMHAGSDVGSDDGAAAAAAAGGAAGGAARGAAGGAAGGAAAAAGAAASAAAVAAGSPVASTPPGTQHLFSPTGSLFSPARRKKGEGKGPTGKQEKATGGEGPAVGTGKGVQGDFTEEEEWDEDEEEDEEEEEEEGEGAGIDAWKLLEEGKGGEGGGRSNRRVSLSGWPGGGAFGAKSKSVGNSGGSRERRRTSISGVVRGAGGEGEHGKGEGNRGQRHGGLGVGKDGERVGVQAAGAATAASRVAATAGATVGGEEEDDGGWAQVLGQRGGVKSKGRVSCSV